MIAPAIAIGALVWLALILAAPAGPSTLAALTYAIGAIVCHQLPERSFHLSGYQLPVCARCLGIYAGFAVTATIALAGRLRFASPGRVVGTARTARGVFIVSAIPTAVTLVLEWSGIWPGSNIVRSFAGVSLGIGVALVVMSAAATLHYNECERRRPTEPSRLPPPI